MQAFLDNVMIILFVLIFGLVAPSLTVAIFGGLV